MTGLVCPKCQGTMRQYERNGVVLDQCGECRGLFLDRGELERLVDAEASWFQRQYPQGPPADSGYAEKPRYESYGSKGSYGYGGRPYRKRRKSFLEELFD